MDGEKHSRVYWWLVAGWIFVLIAGCGILLHELLQEWYVITEFDCGHGRRIVIYAKTFCDQANIPTYEVWKGGSLVSPKFVTASGFNCASPMTAKDFDMVACEDGNLVAVRDTAATIRGQS